MHPKEKHKICTQCDGRISIDTQLCPYCAAEQTVFSQTSQNSQTTSHHHRSLQDSLSSPYTPPYLSKPAQTTEKKPSFKQSFQTKTPPIQKISTETEERAQESEKSPFWPILMLSLGVNLSVLGLLQLFFSDHGVLRLEWDSSRWFLYCLAALPLCFFGLRKAKTL